MKTNSKGYIFSIFSGISASMFFVPYKLALQTLTPILFIWLVYLFSILFNTLLIILQSIQNKNKNFFKTINIRYNLIAGLVFGISSVFGNVAIGKALEHTSTGLAILVLRSDVILVILLGVLFLGEKLNKHFIIGFILSISGFFILNIEQTESFFEFTPLTWAFLGALNFAIIQIALKKNIDKIHPTFINLVRVISGAIIIILLPTFKLMLIDVNILHLLLAGAAAFFGPFMSRNLQIYALKYIFVSEHTLLIMITPVIALILFWLILNEIPTLMSLLGGIIIFIGISWSLVIDIFKKYNGYSLFIKK